MKKVIIASTNPIKIQAAKEGFEKAFPNDEFSFEGISVPSEVSDQPMSNEETLKGAINRANNAMKAKVNADYWVGLEGGVEKVENDVEAFAWIYIRSKEQEGKGKTGLYVLPPKVSELILQGKELGEADDIVFGQTNSKQAQGSIGLLTHNIYVRATYYELAVVEALIPFMNPQYYPNRITILQ